MPDPGGSTGSADLAAAERWFVTHGLPYFVDGIRAEVHRGLARPRLALVGLVAAVLVAVVVAGFGLLDLGGRTASCPGSTSPSCG